jgi:hypothetical protein
MARARHACRRQVSHPLRPLSYAVTSLARWEAATDQTTATWIAHIPFHFFVGQIMFPAGPYLLESSEMADMFSIRPSDHDDPKSLVHAISIPKQNNGLSRKLLFYCREERYFLGQVLIAAAED